MAGIGESLLLVSFCGLCTFLTGISLSAIATNGAMKVDDVCNLLATLPDLLASFCLWGDDYVCQLKQKPLAIPNILIDHA